MIIMILLPPCACAGCARSGRSCRTWGRAGGRWRALASSPAFLEIKIIMMIKMFIRIIINDDSKAFIITSNIDRMHVAQHSSY